jgi:MFS transporter, DHA1 family, inner membrane transport protein
LPPARSGSRHVRGRDRQLRDRRSPPLLVWGLAATAGNLGAGHLADRFGSRRVIHAALVIAVVDFALSRWTTSTVAGAVIVLVVWGLAGWGLLVAQQHRLVAIAPAHAPVLIALNSSAVYVAVSASGVIGAATIAWTGAVWLGLVGAAFLAMALTVTVLAPRTALDPFFSSPRRPAILPADPSSTRDGTALSAKERQGVDG